MSSLVFIPNPTGKTLIKTPQINIDNIGCFLANRTQPSITEISLNGAMETKDTMSKVILLPRLAALQVVLDIRSTRRSVSGSQSREGRPKVAHPFQGWVDGSETFTESREGRKIFPR